MLREIAGRAGLSPAEIEKLEELRRQLPRMAELTGADVFIDCMDGEGGVTVAAQAGPSTADSAYERDVVGQPVLPEREPAVFRAFRLKTPVRDLKAITQEDRAVRQNVVPIFEGERCIAVLISETDISGALRRERKFRQLARTYEEEDPTFRTSRPVPGDDLAVREAHHRVKNDLQLLASIMRLQSRRSPDGAARKILEENTGRVLSIAAIHDILTNTEKNSAGLDSLALLERLARNLRALVPEERGITVRVTGDSVLLPPDRAGAMAIAVNELATNALEHAFAGRERGELVISFSRGSMFHTVTVADDGVGFDPAAPRGQSLGLRIVEATVRDRLQGQLRVSSGGGGSRFSFDLKTE